jgi:hypothetical protein
MYGELKSDEMDMFADSGFNTLMPYNAPTLAEMDSLHAHEISVFFSLKDYFAGTTYAPSGIEVIEDERGAIRETVKKFRRHPALLGWYTNDELPIDYAERSKLHEKWIKQVDRYHPTWSVIWRIEDTPYFLDSFDIIGHTIYPVPKQPISIVGEHAKEMKSYLPKGKSFLPVIQAMDWAIYNTPSNEEERLAAKAPTYDEMRSMAWQTICAGANGVFFYSWFDLKRNPRVSFEEQFRYVGSIAKEISMWAPTLLSTTNVPQVAKMSPTGDAIYYLLKIYEGQLVVFMINNGDKDDMLVLRFFDKKYKMPPMHLEKYELKVYMMPTGEETPIDSIGSSSVGRI